MRDGGIGWQGRMRIAKRDSKKIKEKGRRREENEEWSDERTREEAFQ